jgi:hypothetical protein
METKKERLRIISNRIEIDGHLRYRFIPQVQVIDSKLRSWLIDKSIPFLSSFIDKKTKRKWASFTKENGKVVSFTNERKAEAWLNRQARLEYRNHLGVVKLK